MHALFSPTSPRRSWVQHRMVLSGKQRRIGFSGKPHLPGTDAGGVPCEVGSNIAAFSPAKSSHYMAVLRIIIRYYVSCHFITSYYIMSYYIIYYIIIDYIIYCWVQHRIVFSDKLPCTHRFLRHVPPCEVGSGIASFSQTSGHARKAQTQTCTQGTDAHTSTQARKQSTSADVHTEAICIYTDAVQQTHADTDIHTHASCMKRKNICTYADKRITHGTRETIPPTFI